jgi:group I intron endonuclease
VKQINKINERKVINLMLNENNAEGQQEQKIKCGVYKIKNIINNKVYIGSSKNIENRWKQHIYELNKNNHHSIKLQRAWNKYGKDNFKFEVIEECDIDRLLYLEQYYIDKYKSYFEGYNSKGKTKGLMDWADYENFKIYELYQDDLLECINEKKVIFTDSKTKNRIIYNKYFDKEYMWYKDILYFLNTIYDGNDFFCQIQNRQDEDKAGFIDFDANKNLLYFRIIAYSINFQIEFVYNIKDRSIIHTDAYERNPKIIIPNYDNKITDKLLGYIFYMDEIEQDIIKVSKYTKEYFQLLIPIINDYHVEEIYTYYFHSQKEFLQKMYEYYKNNNLHFRHTNLTQ